MRKILFIFFFAELFSSSAFCQNNSIILDGAYIYMDAGNKNTPIYIVVDQPSTSGIIRTANGGHIHSENQWNMVLWNCGTGTGNYIYPFGVAGNAADYIPFTFSKTTAGNSNVALSTWGTNQQNMSHPDTSNVAAVNHMDCTHMNSTGDSVTAVIDRFWDIKASAATTADLTFTYLGTENTTTNPAGTFKAEHWNGTSWDFPVGPGNAGVTTATGTVGPVLNQTTFSPWALVNIPPPLTITGNTTICNGNSTTLTASGGSSYSWIPTAQTATTIIVNPSTNSTYTVAGLNMNGCPADTNISVTVNPLPTILISGNNTICNGQSATLNASGGNSYSWIPTGQTNGSITVNPTSTSTYTVIGTNANGCSKGTTKIVTVNPLPIINVSSNISVCDGQSATLTASGGISYSWNPGGQTTTSIVVTPPSTTNYTVTGTNSSGCSNDTSTIVTVIPLPNGAVNPQNITITSGTSTTLSASGGSSYTWSNGASTSSATVSPTATTTYTVIISDALGCTVTETVTVEVEHNCSGENAVFIPTAFSPNGDNENDVLIPRSNCLSEIYFAVYNRWGEKVFETTTVGAGWDGKFRGEMENSAVFAWYMKAKLITNQQIEKQGNITLLR